MQQLNGYGNDTGDQGKEPLVHGDAIVGLNGRRNDVFERVDGHQVPQILSAIPYLTDVTAQAQQLDPYAYAIGVGMAGRKAGRKAKRDAKDAGASNKEARAAKKETKATYAEEGTRRHDVLTRRADKLTAKASTSFGSKERKDAMKTVRDERREQIKKNAYKFVVLSVTAPILGAAMALMAINFRGMATKIATATPAEQAKMKKRWEKMGGNFKNYMSVAVANKDKKPFMCAANCKRDLAEDVQKRGAKAVLADVPNAEVDANYSNFVATTAITAAVALGGTLVSSLISMIGKKKETAAIDAQVKAQDKLAEDELNKLSEIEKQKIALSEKQLKRDADWKNKIMQDPTLTAEEKAEAIRIYEGMQGEMDWVKLGMVIGGITAAGIIVYFVVNSFGTKSGGA